jgi:hypothetical protein
LLQISYLFEEACDGSACSSARQVASVPQWGHDKQAKRQHLWGVRFTWRAADASFSVVAGRLR